MGAESQGGSNDQEHENQMIQNLIKNIQLESPAAEPVKAGAQPSTPLSILPGQGEDGWTVGVNVAPPTPETHAVVGTPQSAGRAVPRPLSADLLAAGELNVASGKQQRAATPTAQTNAFDSPQATGGATQGTQSIVLLPGTNIPAHLQDALNSPPKNAPSQTLPSDNPPLPQHPQDEAALYEMHPHYPPYVSQEDLLHHHHQQLHLQHLQALQQQQQTDPSHYQNSVYPVWDNGHLVGYVRMGDEEYQQHPAPGYEYMHERDVYQQQQYEARHIQQRMQPQQQQPQQPPQQQPQQQQPQQQQQQQQNQRSEGDGLARIMELNDLKGRVVEFSRDQEGSRFIQKQISMGITEAEMSMLLDEVTPNMIDLTVDVFGNYVVQKLLEHGHPNQVTRMSGGFSGHILELSLQTYGCRVVQKALEVLPMSFKEMVADELKNSVPRCVQDQNGNHVIQKCIETMPGQVGFIVNAFNGNVHHLATHAYGCRVIQRLLEHCKETAEVLPILNEILSHVSMLVKDQYGNYVVQDLLIHGNEKYRIAVASNLQGKLMDLSRHKFASNVVEKLFQYGTTDERYTFLNELMTVCSPEGHSALLCMVKDQFANYVVQKLLDLSDNAQRAAIINHIRPHAPMLRRFTYGKHIIARVDRLAESLPRTNGGSPGNLADVSDYNHHYPARHIDPMSA